MTAIIVVVATDCERNDPPANPTLPSAEPNDDQQRMEPGKHSAIASEPSAKDALEALLAKLPEAYGATVMLDPEEQGLVQGQIVVRYSNEDRATFWHVKRWKTPEVAKKATERRDRVGSTPQAHRLFNARFGRWVWAGSAPSAELQRVEVALGADDFVSWTP